MVTVAIEVVLAALLLGAAGLGLWQLNRPLPKAGELIVRQVPPSAQLVDARGPLAFRRGHLPGAVHLWARHLLAFEESAGALAEPEQLKREVLSLALEPGAEVVVYDDGSGEEAALVMLVLRAFGFDVRYLAGGVRSWTERGGELSDAPAAELEAGSDELEFDRRLIVDPADARGHIAANEVAPLDVRARQAYLEGHLEGAVNLPVSELLPAGEPPRFSVLSRALGPARITHDTHPLIYGAAPGQAALAWLALAAYGVEHIHVLASPYPALAEAGFPISETATPAATSTRTSSVCWR